MSPVPARWVCLSGPMLVVGEGATADAALADALMQARASGVAIDDITQAEYDPSTHEVRMHGGIVCLVEIAAP